MTEVFELPHNLELISEEKRPSLYGCSSMNTSICSDSTIDLDDFDQIHSTMKDSSCEKKDTKPLQNNFLDKDQTEQALDMRVNEVETPEPSIKPMKQAHPAFNKSVSMHDVSNIVTLNLTAKSNTVSCETINSHSLASTTKSRDSGFQRSLSCLSLRSGKRSYDHVQSKVKAYIDNIRETEALNKKNKLLKNLEKTSEPTVEPTVEAVVDDSEDVVEKDDLIKQIQELKHELHEKSLYIDAQQRNYNRLLLKFAEARNIIDNLRVQSMSYSYSYEDESKNQILLSSNTNLDTFDYKLSRSFRQLGSSIKEEDASETANEVLKETFNPRGHSSPYEKSLSPVSKMFSSSSRLDKNYQPLMNPKQNERHCRSRAHDTSKNEVLTSNFDASKNGFKSNNQSNLLQQQPLTIDLPNDDPFDKVKKWQASLPSINLLGSYSSSDCEGPEQNLSLCTTYLSSKNNEGILLNTNTMENENEISNLLSQELRSKCIITETDMNKEQSLKNNQVVNKTFKEERRNVYGISRKISEEDVSLYKNNITALKNRCELIPKHKNTSNKPLNCIKGGKTSTGFASNRINLPPSHSKDSSLSEDVSTHLPKTSSLSNCRINNLENDNSDDSSSISSSVLSSDSPPSSGSNKRVKRRLYFGEDEVSKKVPKITKSKSSQTTFVLREPKLNFIPHFENCKSQMISNIHSHKHKETSLEHRDSKNNPMKTESSQRKAWNARNNANFYVCKDFNFSKNASLMECIKDMEGLVSKGALVIRSVVDRNNISC